MNTAMKYVLGVIVLVAIAGGAYAFRKTPPAPQEKPQETAPVAEAPKPAAPQVHVPAATASIDDLTAALEAEGSAESTLASSSDADKVFVTADAETVTSFDQTYDESLFQ